RHAPVGHARREGAPRSAAGDDREVREPPALALCRTALPEGLHLQCRGEPADAGHQREHRLRARIVRRRLAEAAAARGGGGSVSDRLLLSTPRLDLREMTESDLPALRAILQDPETMTAYEGAFDEQTVQ